MTKQIEGQMSIFDLLDQDTVFGRTCPAHSHHQERTSGVKISDVSLKSSQESQTKMPLFLDLRGVNGQQAGASWETGGLLLGCFTMDSFGESPSSMTVENWSRRVHPNAVEESRLSQILVEKAHPRYYLSPKACMGILTRSRRRGKALPERLERALIAQSRSKNEPDVRGGVKESSYKKTESELCKPIVPNTSCLNLTDKTQGINGDVAETLDASYYKGCGERQGKEREVVVFSDVAATRTAQDGRGGVHTMMLSNPEQNFVIENKGGGTDSRYDNREPSYGIDRAAFNQGQNAQFDFCVDKELSPSIVARGPGAVLQEVEDGQ